MHDRLSIRFFVAALAIALAAAGCGSGSTQLTGPTTVKCQATVSGLPSTVPAGGTQVTASVSAERECSWTISSEASWVQVTPGSGQGQASLTVKVAENDAAAPRSGAIVLNGQRVSLSQEAAPCKFSLATPSVAVNSAGGSVAVAVQTLAGCRWQASGGSWIQVVRGTGTGSGTAEFNVAPNTGPARSATVTVAGIAWRVDQAAAGLPAPPPTDPTPPPTGPPPPPPPPTDPPPPEPVPEEAIQLYGRVSGLSGGCPGLTFRLDGRNVYTDASTTFKSGNCRHMEDGRWVTVEGVVLDSGLVYAAVVEIRQRDDDDDD